MTELRAIVGAMSLFFVMGTTQAQNTQYEAALNGWSRVLSRFVDADGRVDFRALAGDRADLDQFIEYIAGVSPGSHSDLFL